MWTHDFSPFLFSLGGFELRYYSLAYLIGVLATYLWMVYKGGYDKGKVLDFVCLGLGAVVIGGRLGHVLFYHPQWIWTDFWRVFRVWEGGLSFHGGLIAVILFAIWYAKKQEWNLLRLFDHIVIPASLGLILATIANFFNSELWGRQTDVPWCFYVEGLDGCRHPSMLYQSLKNFILLLLLIFFYLRKLKTGTLGALFLIGYGIGRSTIEIFWREPDWVFWGITSGTWLSIPMIIVGAGLLVFVQKRSS